MGDWIRSVQSGTAILALVGWREQLPDMRCSSMLIPRGANWTKGDFSGDCPLRPYLGGRPFDVQSSERIVFYLNSVSSTGEIEQLRNRHPDKSVFPNHSAGRTELLPSHLIELCQFSLNQGVVALKSAFFYI
jgi:hypothetical protein